MMWKRDEGASEKVVRSAESARAPERPARTGGGEHAVLGRSITIRGDVTGEEDLIIQGRVEGTVSLKDHAITVGVDGEVKANIVAKVITVEGRVEGNLSADESIFLRRSAHVDGDLVSPRVALEDGARFLGSVRMGEAAKQARAQSQSAPVAGTSVPPGSNASADGAVARKEPPPGPKAPPSTEGGAGSKEPTDARTKARA